MARDYRAEYARRNALAQSRGFTGYAQQRAAIERGKVAPIQPNRISSPRTRHNQQKFNPPVWQSLKNAVTSVINSVTDIGVDAAELPSNAYDEAVAAIYGDSSDKLSDVNERWSEAHFTRSSSEYDPDSHGDYGLTREEYDQAYYDAWVDPDGGYYGDNTNLEDLEYWLCDVLEVMTHEEFDEKYRQE